MWMFNAMLAVSMAAADAPSPTPIVPKMVHLRSGAVREWSEFPETAEAAQAAAGAGR